MKIRHIWTSFLANGPALLSAHFGLYCPLRSQPRVRGARLKLQITQPGWELDFSGLHHCYREAT